MKKLIWVVMLCAVTLVMAGCGSGSKSGNIDGNWSAQLTNTSDGNVDYAFSTTFSGSSGGGFNISNFHLTTTGNCFSGVTTTETGSFTLGGNFNGNVTGTFGMTITTQFAGGGTQNVLTLSNGAVTGNTISGTWALTGGSGCNGQGTFTFNKM